MSNPILCLGSVFAENCEHSIRKIVTLNDGHQIAIDILDEGQYAHFKKHGQFDLAYNYDEDRRFRVNIFMTRGKVSLACRLITSNIKTFEQLHIPEILGPVAMSANGLILFAGVTGSGKSTSIAAMLQYVNARKRCHIVTIEDPIEYIFKDDKASINQREVGIDCLDFNEALRALVREDPDVVLVGEMRDKETFEAAIRAAETGHLVFGTIHASSAWQTFGRIYDLFDQDEVEQIRKLLAYNLRAIVYQKLLPTLHGRHPPNTSSGDSAGYPCRSRSTSSRHAKANCSTSSARATRKACSTSPLALVKLVEEEMIHHRCGARSHPEA